MLYPIAGSTQIIPIITGEFHSATVLSDHLKTQGLWTQAITAPTVAKHQSRLRLSLSAAHGISQLQKMAEVLNVYFTNR